MEATATRTYTCMGCGLTVTADTDYTGQLCETCELVALAIVDGDNEHREAFGAKFEEITRRAERACCSRCAKDLGWSVDAVLICWREFPMILCDDCSDEALRAEEDAARVASDYAAQVAANEALGREPGPIAHLPRAEPTHAQRQRERRYEEQRTRDAQVMREGADEPRGF